MASLRTFNGPDPLYALQSELGQGAYGRVFKARRVDDDQVVAKKVIALNKDTYNSVLAELQALHRLGGCRNVVQWSNDVGFDVFNHHVHIHTDYYPMGDLSHAIQEHRWENTRFSELDVLEMFRDISNALSDCHAKGILHRDLKPSNILLGQVTARGSRYPSGLRTGYFLTDFGVGKLTLGAVLNIDVAASSPAGTIGYIAPEVYQQRRVGPEADIFSLGCVMYEVCELRPAFRSMQKTVIPYMSSPYGQTTRNTIMACMALYHRARPEMTLLIERLQILVITKRNRIPQPPRSSRSSRSQLLICERDSYPCYSTRCECYNRFG